MLKSFFLSSFTYATVATIVALVMLDVTVAQVRTSSNYQLQSDSINVGGGYSTSSSYIQESTVGEIATGRATSTSYNLLAGYQQMQDVFISISVTGDVSMTPDIGGLTGGTSNGSTTVTVTTDSPSGYQLLISAENDPAMQSSFDTIDDYNAGAEPDYTFTTAAADAHFGFSPEGVDIVQAFLNLGTDCNSGSAVDSLACWDGMATTTKTMAEGSGANHPDGATTTVHFRVGVGSAAGVTAGLYTATTTVTALPL